MSERLRQVRERLETIAQLDVVVTAMRGIAASHLREVHSQLASIRAYATTIGMAIGVVMATVKKDSVVKREIGEHIGELIIVVCSEQGFAGNFNEQVFDELELYTGENGTKDILLVGSRGSGVALDRHVGVLRTLSMATRVDSIPALAIVLADDIYDRIDRGDFRRISLVHAEYGASEKFKTVVRSLIPFDYSRFQIPVRTISPVLTMEPLELVSRLAQEYVYAELCDALMLSYAAENACRVRTMVRARTNMKKTEKSLRVDYQQLRQEQITSEITELSVGNRCDSTW